MITTVTLILNLRIFVPVTIKAIKEVVESPKLHAPDVFLAAVMFLLLSSNVIALSQTLGK